MNKELNSLIFLLLFHVAGFCFNPDVRFNNISINEGLSQSQANRIRQDNMGFIWIATQDGLNRFDGYEFKIYKESLKNDSSLLGNYIYDLEISTHEVWVSTDKGLNKINLLNNQIERYTHDSKNPESISSNQIRNIFITSNNEVWVTDVYGTINIYNASQNTFKHIKLPQLSSNINHIYVDKHHNYWLATEENGIYIIQSNFNILYHGLLSEFSIKHIFFHHVLSEIWLSTSEGVKTITNPWFYLKKSQPDVKTSNIISNSVKVNKIIENQKNEIFIATEGEGLYKLQAKNKPDKNWEIENYKNSEYSKNSIADNIIYDVFVDKNNMLWIGTYNGISKYYTDNQFIKTIRKSKEHNNTLINENIWSILEDKKNTIWVGARQGLTSIKNKNTYINYSNISTHPLFKKNQIILSLFEDSKNRLWIGTVCELIQVYRDTSNSIIATEKILSWENDKKNPVENRVYKIAEDKKGNILIGTKTGFGIINPEKNIKIFITQFLNPITNEYINLQSVRDIKIDSHDGIWLATETGVYYMEYDSLNIRSIRFNNPFPNIQEQITSIALLNNNQIWLGTYGAGIRKVNIANGSFEILSEDDGLSNNVIYGILQDANNVWISTNNGISVVDKKTNRITFYTEKDGLQSNEFNAGAYFKGEKNIYFGGIRGFNIIEPDKYYKNYIKPLPIITDIKINNKNIFSHSNPYYLNEILLKHFQNNIQINFTGIQFTSPEKNQFYFKLSPIESDWIILKNSRSAIYNNLAPGKYTFVLKVCNADDVCSQTISLNITIKPVFWQTGLFKFSAIALLVIIVFLGVRTRINLVNNQKKALESIVDRRTREVIRQKEQIEHQKEELELEKKKAEDLLKQILPEQTVYELQAKGKVTALNFKVATVMFTDFKDFTKIAEEISPKELLLKLDTHFRKFDEIIEKYNVEKIKTMGDSYMAAGGIPIRNRSNPYDVALAALEIQNYMQTANQESIAKGEKPWEIRIGIHTGELIAGVIGTKRFAYDIWGDTVNVTSRIESSCEAGKINISGQTYTVIKDFFNCTYRGKIEAKNKGVIDMYYLEGLYKDYALAENPKLPSIEYFKALQMYLFGHVISYRKAERNIINRLKTELPDNLYYHSLQHTLDVRDAVNRIATSEGLNNEEILLLKTAALYHDAGFIKSYHKNETIGAQMAKEDLEKYGYTPKQIERIIALIKSTAYPYNPSDILEQILCDADLDYLGREDFFEISEKLRKEYLERGIVQTNEEFDQLQIKFLTEHKYFTQTAIETRKNTKIKHLEFLKSQNEKDINKS